MLWGWSQSAPSWRRCHWLKLQAVGKEAHLDITAQMRMIEQIYLPKWMYKPQLTSLMEALMHRGALNLHHFAIGPNELSEAALPHKTQLTLGVQYKLNFSRWLNHLELIQTLLPGLIVWSLCWNNKQTYKSFRDKEDRNKANNLQWFLEQEVKGSHLYSQTHESFQFGLSAKEPGKSNSIRNLFL